MEKTDMFDGRATNYLLGRPSYAQGFIHYLQEEYKNGPDTLVADVGSGTGKLALQLLNIGFSVYGIEPNDDMRKTAEQLLGKYERFYTIKGSASSTNAPAGKFDFVTTAQAFHWFNVLEFKSECQRILKKSGKVFLIWNMRDMERDLNLESFHIYKKYCPNFKGFGGGIQKDDDRIKLFFDGRYEVLQYDNPLFYTKEEFISRSLSGSYSLNQGDIRYDEYITELKDLFDKYSKNEILELPNQTIVYAGVISE